MHNIEEYHENYWSGMVWRALSIVKHRHTRPKIIYLLHHELV